MQNKGAIRVVAIIFALICLYQLSFTYFSKKVESNAKEYATNQYAKNLAANLAKGDALREQEIFDSIATMRENFYLDSVSEKTAYNFLWMRKFSYKECKAQGGSRLSNRQPHLQSRALRQQGYSCRYYKGVRRY